MASTLKSLRNGTVGFTMSWASADAHRDDGKRFIVRADEKLTAFVELQRAIRELAVSLIA